MEKVVRKINPTNLMRKPKKNKMRIQLLKLIRRKLRRRRNRLLQTLK